MASRDIKFITRKGNSLLHKLHRRSLGFLGRVNRYYQERDFHTHILPNFSIIDVEKPPCFLRKFSPDGQHFIAFSSDQASIEIFEFQGPGAAADLLRDCEGSLIDETTPAVDYQTIRTQAFHRFFKLKHTVVVASGHNQSLNRECSLFTDDSRYLIVGSASAPSTEDSPYAETHQTNEAVATEPRSLETYNIYVIDLDLGVLCDSRTYKHDKITLSHNQGIYLYGSTLALLSVQHQIIHIIGISDQGILTDLLHIGRFCMDDDELYYNMGAESESGRLYIKNQLKRHPPNIPRYRPWSQKSLGSLKQRLLSYLYRSARDEGPERLHQFYTYFDHFYGLRMWKMQLVNEDVLLIKFGTEKMVMLQEEDPQSHPSFFVLYHIYTTEVLGVWENSSTKMLDLVESFADQLRNVFSGQGHCNISSARSNIYSRQIQDRFKQSLINVKRGGHTEYVKRTLAQYPISAQSYSTSPYLDLTLFSYDNKWVSVLERPKNCGDYPIRFFGRKDGLIKYRIHTGSSNDRSNAASRRLVAFTFHPSMPFAISVQRRTSSQYIVNLHVRHVPS